jgi:multidrug efflux pump subunit AcrA (membrane-fusion protein)
MKINWKLILIVVVLAGLTVFNIVVLSNTAPHSNPVSAVDPTAAPVRFYGSIEPAGGNVYLSPPIARSVVAIYANEGDPVSKGQQICLLDGEVERAQLAVNRSRAASQSKSLDISRDTYQRNKTLHENGSISEYEYSQSKLKYELDSRQLATTLNEIALAQAQLERLNLVSPIDGRIYKLDVRLGETLPAGGNDKIILGADELNARMYAESFWIDKIKPGDRYSVYDAETGDKVADGEVISKGNAMGSREFRTEDPRDRADNKYLEIVLRLSSVKPGLPIGLTVMASLPDTK